MPPRKPISHNILPECAANQATFLEQMRQTTEIQQQLIKEVFGNGKIGLRQVGTKNTEDIQEILTSLRGENEIRKEETKVRQAETIARAVETQVREAETEVRKAETEQRVLEQSKRKDDIRKWWLGVAAAIIIAIIAIMQDVATQAALARLSALVKLSP
jgi:hypothetical protein